MRLSVLALTLTLAATAAVAGSPATAPVPVLLELFTSEGCSSCPPADRILQTLDHNQPVSGATVIVLSEHVDYWNQLGWTDPYSSAANSKRQNEYGTRFHLDSVYTPQLVIDGHTQVIGNDEQAVKAGISAAVQAPKLPVSLTVAPAQEGSVTVEVNLTATGAGGTVYLALATDQEESQVKRGENGGRSLTHVAVLRSLTSVGRAAKNSSFHQSTTLRLPAPGDRHRWRLVAFLQNERSGQILGVQQEHL